MSKNSFADQIRVNDPCTQDWETMTGNDQVRFCDHCSKHVNNISEMTQKQAVRLVTASKGQLCIRYLKNPETNGPFFAEQLTQIMRHAPRLTAGVMAASLSLSSMALAQGNAIVTDPLVKVSRDKNKEKQPDTGDGVSRISGTVMDQQQAVIPGAEVSLFDKDDIMIDKTTTNGDGKYEFSRVMPGVYKVTIDSHGFRKYTAGLSVVNDTPQQLNATLGTGEVMGVVMVSRIEYRNPLTAAVISGEIDEVREQIAKGTSVNEKEADGRTPLTYAVDYGNVEIVRLLLDLGAKANARDADKRTPLMRMDDDATPELAQMLIDAGAKVDTVDKDGNTALIATARDVKPEVLKVLIDAGADVNLTNSEGQTALMNAADGEQLESVRALLMAGAEVNARNKEGKSAWDLTGNHDIENLLVSFGAETKETQPETPGTDPPQ